MPFSLQAVKAEAKVFKPSPPRNRAEAGIFKRGSLRGILAEAVKRIARAEAIR